MKKPKGKKRKPKLYSRAHRLSLMFAGMSGGVSPRHLDRCPLRALAGGLGKQPKDKRCKGVPVFRSWNSYGKGVTEFYCETCWRHLFYLGRKRILPLRGI